MSTLLSCCLSLCLAAAPAGGGRHGPPVQAGEGARPTLERAREAWRRGDFSEVRALLEPLAREPDKVEDAQDRQSLWVLLADAALGDLTLDPSERRDLARAQLESLMDAEPDWRMPKDFYSPELYDLYTELRVERAARRGTECEGERVACRSDLAGARAQLERERALRANLQKRYDDQEVQVVESVARTRVLAAIPFGFGHFYNAGVGTRRRSGRPPTRGDRVDLALGASFLTAEAIVGAAGLGLLLRRVAVDGCRRTRGFSTASLRCDPPDGPAGREGIALRRKAEEGLAWSLLGLVTLEIILAQIRFRPTETREIRRAPRRQLDVEGSEPTAPDPPRPRRTRPRATLRAAPMVSSDGAALGVDVRF